MNKTDQLRNLPAVDEVLRSDALSDLRECCPHHRLVGWVRDALERVRQTMRDGGEVDLSALPDSIAAHVRQAATVEQQQSLQTVINATGVLLHTNLGRAPLAQAAIDRMLRAAAYSNVELDLRSGQRSGRGARVLKLLAELTGAESALVVNNCAGATMLVLQAIAGGREVIISRGQLVEIGGGFRLPEVFTAAGAVLREVGTTNRTYLRDYEQALNDQTGAIIRVHHSNFQQSGFVEEPTIKELAGIRRPSTIPVVDDLGSGCIRDLSAYGVSEPTVTESVGAGAELTLFSGDKLFGGPQCGIIVGRQSWIRQLRESPMMRALRVDKVTLAGLEATTEIHLSEGRLDELPLFKMLGRKSESVRDTCVSVRQQIAGVSSARIEVVPCESRIGGGTLPGATLSSYALKITGCKTSELSRSLRLGTPAVQSRAADDGLLLDLRTVAPSEVDLLVSQLRRALAQGSGV